MAGELVAADAEHVLYLAEAARSQATRRSYAAALRVFLQYCENAKLESMPAAPATVALFVAARHQAGFAASTMARDVCAIAAAHVERGMDDPTAHPMVRQVLRGARRSVGLAPQRRAAALATADIRRMVACVCAQGGVSALRDTAIIVVGFAAALRRSEVSALAVEDVDFRDDGMVLTIRRSKTDQAGKGAAIGVPWGGHVDTCPVRAMKAWLAALSGEGFTSGPVFRRLHKGGVVGRAGLTGHSVGQVVQRAARVAGIAKADVSGHSLRAGHITTAAMQGVPVERIARVSRHARLDTLTAYIRPVRAMNDSTAGELGL